jgi:hypothetical protein
MLREVILEVLAARRLDDGLHQIGTVVADCGRPLSRSAIPTPAEKTIRPLINTAADTPGEPERSAKLLRPC